MDLYTLPDLRYDYSALEPHISGKLMELHHTKHHAAYVKNANSVLARAAHPRNRNAPFGDGLALAAGPRAPDNDGNSKHRCSSVTEPIFLISVVEVAIEEL